MEPFQLGNWQVFPKLNQLTLISGEKTETVTPKVMQLLLVLVKQDNDPIGLEEIIVQVWLQRVVADSSVYQAIAQLRKVLAQDTEHPVYVERISGQGYRISPDIIVSSVIPKRDSNRTFAVSLFSILVIVLIALWLYKKQPSAENSDHFFESLSLASHLLTQKQPTQLHHAKQLYLEVLRKDKNHVEALNGLCNSYRLLTIYDTMSETERDSLCQPLLEKAYALQPENPNVLASMARQSFEQGNIAQSELLFEQALAITDQQAAIWHWYGQLKRKHNQVESALIAHEKAFKLAPNSPIILRGLAYAHLNNRDLDSARKYFERSVVIAPKFKNRPLYELDFYPLNQQRAENYLAWYKKHQQSYLAKYPSHKLSYIIFLLSLNQTELAVEEMNKMEELKGVPHHFLLYVKASLAWHQQQPTKALSLLKQRYQLAPEKNHYVMPYLVALVNLDKAEQALTLFEQHFPDVVTLDTIGSKQLGQYLLLTSLYQSTGKEKRFERAYANLLSLRQEHSQFPLHNELIWSDITNDKSLVHQHLTQMLEDGWLPDYNDNMFSVSYYQSLLDSEQETKSWLEQLSQKQKCIWQQKTCSTKG